MTDRYHGSLIVYPNFSIEIQIYKLTTSDEHTFYRPLVIIEHKRPYPMWDYSSNGLVFTTTDEYWVNHDFKTLKEAEKFVACLSKAVNLSAIG